MKLGLPVFIRIVIFALFLGLLTFGSALANRPAAPPPLAGTDWPNYGGGYYNQRYSTLNQINTGNVANLKGAWTFHVNYGDKSSSFESTPVVVNGVMYLTSGRDDVYALDATNGNKKWEYHPNIDLTGVNVCCGVVNRGVAIGNNKVFVGQVDGKLVALDQNTGQKAWEVEVGSPKDGYSETMAPQFYNGMVIIGISGAEYENRGYVTAYNADDGQQVWRWYTIPKPGDPGSETWPSGSDIWQHGGGSMWMTPSIDPDLGLVYLAIGNPGPDLDGTVRKGDNLYTESIVALDVKTGQYRWHYQEVRHDIWDYDAVSPVVLFDTTLNGQAVKALAQAGKTGWVYILDRATGKPLIPIDEQAVPQDPKQNTAATQPFPQGDPFSEHDATGINSPYPKGKIFTPFEQSPILMLPGANGGNEWSPISYSPATNFVYIDDIYQPQIFTMNPSQIEEGHLKLGSSFTGPPGTMTHGNLVAIDARTNKIAWKKPQTYMMIGGTTTTAGGLVFAGQGDGNFQAYDAKTGNQLWSFQTGAGANAAPSAYQVNGQEYVAVASGGNFQLDFPRGDTLWVFALNGTMGPVAAPPQPATTVSKSPSGAPTTTESVTIQEFKFVPSNNVIHVGTTVTFKNNGPAFPHSATADDGKTFDTKVLQVGQSATVTFDKVGSFTFHCIPHPWMTGVIQVVAASAPLPAPASTSPTAAATSASERGGAAAPTSAPGTPSAGPTTAATAVATTAATAVPTAPAAAAATVEATPATAPTTGTSGPGLDPFVFMLIIVLVVTVLGLILSRYTGLGRRDG